MNNNFFNLRFFALLLAVCLASCKVQQDYKRPELALPSQFPGDGGAADTGSIATLNWKVFFTDPTLQALISRGLQNNYDLQIAIRNIGIANEQLRQAKTLQLPQIDAEVNGQFDRPSQNSLDGATANSFLGNPNIQNYQANFDLSWEADIWGKIRMQRQEARAQYLQTAEAARAVQTKLVADIAEGYYNLLMLDAQLAIAVYNLKLSDTTLLLTTLQRDAGNVTTLAVEQAYAQRKATEALIPGLRQSIAVQEHALCILTGDMPGAIKRSVRLREIKMADSLPAGIPAGMVSRRPDVHAAELALVAADRRVGIARASLYPSLDISAQAGFNSFKASNWFAIPASLFGLVGGGVTQPIFEHRTLKTKYKTALLQREQYVLQFRQAVLNAVGEVADALVKQQQLTEQQQINLERADTLHRAVTNAQLLFRSDMATYLEVITAQSNALQAELDLANTRKQRLYAVVDLYRALGGGVD